MNNIMVEDKKSSLFFDCMKKYMEENYRVSSDIVEKLVNKYKDKIDTDDITTQHLGPDYFALQILMVEKIIQYKPI